MNHFTKGRIMQRKVKVDLLWTAVFVAAALVLLFLPIQTARGQCVGGSCPAPQVNARVQVRQIGRAHV